MLFFPGLLSTGEVTPQLLTIRDVFVNMYIIKTATKLVCIDTGWRPNHILREFNTLQLDIKEVSAVFLTHQHWDHARCTEIFAHAEIYVGEKVITAGSNKKKQSRPWITVQDNQQITVSGLQIRSINTPGHTKDSVSFLVNDNLLFTGDCLRLKQGKVLPFHACFNNDNKIITRSIRKLANIPDVGSLLTAHTGLTNNTDLAFSQWRYHSTDKEERI